MSSWHGSSSAEYDSPSRRPHAPARQMPMDSSAWLSFLPLILSFLAAIAFAWQTLFPLLSGHHSPSHDSARWAFRLPTRISTWLALVSDRVVVATFSITVGLSAVLAELIVCEIAELIEHAARARALQLTVSALLVSLILVIPALEVHAITSAAAWRASGFSRRFRLAAWSADIIGFLLWLAAFWLLGRAVLHGEKGLLARASDAAVHGWSEGSVERIAIIGVTLMASLAGFAAVSAPWQTFGNRSRPVTDSDVARRQAGLDAATDMLQQKQLRLRTLESRVSESAQRPSSPSFFTRVAAAVRPDATAQELSALRVEVAGLETMQRGLSTAVETLRARRAQQQRATTPIGKLLLVISYAFALYCVFRIGATSLATIQRYLLPRPAHASGLAGSSDPVSRALAVLAAHWDPRLDRAAWARQLALLLAALMLLGAFHSVLQTLLLLSRAAPAPARRALLSLARPAPSSKPSAHHPSRTSSLPPPSGPPPPASAARALLAAQMTGTYVVSAALLLRRTIPAQYGGAVAGALGAPLEPAFVERWFEGWFLGAAVVTAVGIWVGRRTIGAGAFIDGDEEGAEEDGGGGWYFNEDALDEVWRAGRAEGGKRL